MLSFDTFFIRKEFQKWHTLFHAALEKRCDPKRWGDLPDWESALELLPNTLASEINLSTDAIRIGSENDLTTNQREDLIHALKSMMPWRKGPFDFFGTHLDCEWRSDWKWQRILPHIGHLTDKKILDVGCGTGYHGWRMLGEGANYVMGIDPSMRFAYQHAMAQTYIQSNQFDFLPIGIEDMPQNMAFFDTVFSMGVLYHRKDPDSHLTELYQLLKPKGELILETLVVDDDFKLINEGIFTPPGRYAKMRNVWSIATVKHLLQQLKYAGFQNPSCVDISVTSINEQRSTQWMTFQSLKDYLNPLDSSQTIEGHPAPMRATIIAQKS